MSERPQSWALAALVALLSLAGCRNGLMYNMPRTRTDRGSAVFADGTSMRLPPAGTVARGSLGLTAPPELSAALLDRGDERFQIYCKPCHGALGRGDGTVARRGFFAPPVASLQDARLRDASAAYLYGVVTNGFNTMPRYGDLIPPRDRWAIVAYVRALQLSQNADPGDVPDVERTRLNGSQP